MIPLFEKYRPKKFSDIRGQELAINRIKAFVKSFESGLSKKKALLLHGPAGTGKTTLALVTANEFGYELFELNASDLRNRAKLDEIMRPSSEQKSLFAKGKIILIDEVDGVTSTEYGGLAELVAIIEKTQFPIIITCNNVWQNKFNLLRRKCELVPLKEIPYLTVYNLLKNITEFEKKEIPENIIKEIAVKSGGDLRAALNDLQSIINLNSSELMEEQIYLREKSQSIFNAIKEVLKVKINENTTNAYENVELDIDQITLWLEENIPIDYRGEELAKAFQALSKADIFRGRIHRQQYWHFLVYENFFLTAGVSAAKGIKNLPDKFVRYNPPKRIFKIWMANQKNMKKKSIVGKLAELVHTSKKRAEREFNIFCLIIDADTECQLNLSQEEVEYLNEKRLEIKNKILSKLSK